MGRALGIVGTGVDRIKTPRFGNYSKKPTHLIRTDPIPVLIPRKFQGLFRPNRYKIMYGGRGAAKSRSVAAALVTLAHCSKKRILCTREYQSSIGDSVYKLLVDQIDRLKLRPYFHITLRSIVHKSTGSEFLFKGLRRDISSIKSTEGIDIVWIEEAQSVSEDSWKVLIPTIRQPGSEIWITFNPEAVDDPTYKRFVLKADPSWFVVKVNWDDNPYFPADLELERAYMLANDPEAYEHVWNGFPLVLSNAVIFKARTKVWSFETPNTVKNFKFGLDFGFAADPTVGIRSWIDEAANELYIDHEAVGYGVELDHIPAMLAGDCPDKKNPQWENPQHYEGIPGALQWSWRADSARPETISYIRRKGFQIDAAKKWAGSVEDGITHLKGFKCINIHERCKNMAQESRLYSWKVEKLTGAIQPIPVDAHNHGWDAARYALDGYISGRGGLATWERLGRAGSKR